MSFFYCQKNIPRGYLLPGYPRPLPSNKGQGIQATPRLSLGVCQKTKGEGVHTQMPNRSSRWKFIRQMAYDRDRKLNAVCWWCRQPINYIVKPSSMPDAYEADHKIPVSKRADLELDLNNIAPSHMRCNRSRGDGTNGENVLGMQSRIW